MNWNDVTLKQYQNLCSELNETYPDDLSRSIGLLSALTGNLISHYENLPIPQLKKEIQGLEFIKDKPAKSKVVSRIKIGKKRFRFTLNMNTILASQYIDLTELVKDNKKINDNMHLILAVMCHEINFFGFKKETETKDRAEYLLNNISMPHVFALSGFFLNNYQRLTKATNVYLALERKKAMKKTSEAIDLALSVIGDGITPLDNLSNNDRTKWDYFLDMNVIEFLNTLAYFKDKQGYIEDQLEKQRRKYGSR